MEIFINLQGKLNKASLPLRFGFSLSQQHQSFATLDNEEYDPIGTERQRGDEINQGRKHFLGTLIVNKEQKNDGQYIQKGRFVIAPPPPDRDLHRLVTVLRNDAENLKNDIATSRHLEGMHKRSRITTVEIIRYLHPAYLEGKITESNDIEDILTDLIIPNRPKAKLILSTSEQGFVESGPEITDAIDDIDVDEDTDDGEKITPLVFKKLDLKPSIKYSYVMADAHILDAGKRDDLIWVRVINSKGIEQELRSFSVRAHLSHHHDRALEYFKSRIGERGFMAICVSDKYNGVLAESVTSIALDLMKERR